MLSTLSQAEPLARATRTAAALEMASSSESREKDAHALYRAAHTHLQQRGYSNINARLNCAQPGEAERPREEKLNEMVGREAMRKATRAALQLFAAQPKCYGEQWAQLAQWLNACPASQQRELLPMYFPMFVHCYLALVARGETEVAAQILQLQMQRLHHDQRHKDQCELLPIPRTRTPTPTPTPTPPPTPTPMPTPAPTPTPTQPNPT